MIAKAATGILWQPFFHDVKTPEDEQATNAVQKQISQDSQLIMQQNMEKLKGLGNKSIR